MDVFLSYKVHQAEYAIRIGAVLQEYVNTFSTCRRRGSRRVAPVRELRAAGERRAPGRSLGRLRRRRRGG